MGKTKAFSTTIKLGVMGIICAPLFLIAKVVNGETISHISSVAPDSIGTEVVNGEVYIIHRVERKDTYYALGRRYTAPVSRIMSVNNKKSLKPGDIVKVPTGKQEILAAPIVQSPSSAPPLQQEQSKVLTEYKVGKKETLYAIARRFGTTVEDIKKMNDLRSDSLREGITLKIPNADYREPVPEVVEQPIILDTLSTSEPLTPEQIVKANRYGIREKQEKGIGVWINNLETDGKSNLALHKTAPVGTILKITNPMTRNVTYAKVVGKFTDTADTKDAIVVLSKSAAAYIGALDRRFLIEIAYGVPVQ